MRKPANARGFTYMGLVFAVFCLTIGLAATAILWRVEAQREREAELLFIGSEFQRAIGAYYAGSPEKARDFPRKLEHLIRDPRYPDVRRYLRKIYVDPMTRTPEWGLVKTPAGAITGVYSRSDRTPLKRTNFPAGIAFEAVQRYSDWRFDYAAASNAFPSAAAQRANAGGVPATTQPESSPSTAVPADTSAPILPAAQESHCSTLARDDRAACSEAAQRWGEELGALCQASAPARVAACLQGRRLPALPTQP